MTTFHHRKLPDHSTLLSGRTPQDDTGFPSARLQIWYNNTDLSNDETTDDGGLLPEYDFDYSEAKPNRFATGEDRKE